MRNWKRTLRWAGALTAMGVAAGVFAEGSATSSQPATGPASAPATQETPRYMDLNLSFKERAADLVSRLSLQEKAIQMQVAVVQDKEGKELGIPAMNWWSEAVHGISRAGKATQFPQALAMAAAWDPAMMHRVGDVIAEEARAKYFPDAGEHGRYYGLTIWAPAINMTRDPRWGRTQECYGEDPVLTSRLAVEFIKGLQGDDPKYLKTVATPKHFAMHSQETGRHNSSFDISERTLREYYLPAFHDCFVEGKAASTMAAFSGINAMPCTENHWLLTDLLRGEWGFDGAVVTDWGGVQNLGGRGFNLYPDLDEAAAAAINAGVDVICNPEPMVPQVINAVKRGFLKEKELDQALVRNFTLRFRLGMFDPPEKVPFTTAVRDPAALRGILNAEDHQALALQAARESIVLLQNNAAPAGYGFERLLPLDLRKVHSIALLGPYADITQFGNYSGDAVRPAITPFAGLSGAFTGTGPWAVNPAIAGVGQVGVGDRVRLVTGNWIDPTKAAAVAASCDVAVVVVGLTSDRRGDQFATQPEEEGMDRQTLELPQQQLNLIKAVSAANPLTIVVLEGGGVIGCEEIKKQVPAIVMLWYPGERGGTALADVLLGKVNPSGRLPLTFYRSVQDLPPLTDYEISKGRTYMYASKPACFVFGHGLSYTTFAYKNLQVDAPVDGRVRVTVEVTNTGAMAGDEVVQVYAHKVNSAVTRPIKQLVAFERVTVPVGETRQVKMTMRLSDVAYWDTAHHVFVLEKGAYEIMAGGSSEDVRLRGTVDVK